MGEQDFLDKGLGIHEIAQGTTTEQMSALFFDAKALREPNYRLNQLNVKGKRYYYLFDENGEPRFFPSVTTVLRNVMPENKILVEWKLSLGKEASEAYTMEKANYGTFLHGCIAELMINRRFNLDSVREKLGKFVEREKLPYGFVEAYESEAKADIKAFAKWMKDYDVRPLAVEVALYSETMGVAGMLDCVANMRKYSKSDKKNGGNEERINAIVDYKSGRKGFYDEYAIQLEIYRRTWNENFPEMEISQIFNIAPKDWTRTVKKEVSYSFEEQTENPVVRKTDLLIELFKMEEEESRKIVAISGVIDLDSDIDDNVSIYTLDELVKAHHTDETSAEEDDSDPFKALLQGE